VFILHRDENLLSCKRPSGGLAVYVRDKFVLNDTLYFQGQDDILCIKLAADKVNLQNDVYICLCYVIPENSSRQAFVTTHTYDRLLDFYTGLSIKYGDALNFILCGDFNSRTSNLPDFVTDDNASNFGFLPEDYCADVNLTRQSLGNGRLNSYGTQLLDICKQSGLRILNGRVGDDQNIGKYTYVASTGSSVVDYVISTPNMFNYISHFVVHEPNILSDHCIVDFDLTFETRIVADGPWIVPQFLNLRPKMAKSIVYVITLITNRNHAFHCLN